MSSEDLKITAELVTCPDCDTELELNENETLERRFICPECGAKYELDATPISNDVAAMIETREILLSFWDKLDFWYTPAMLVFLTFTFVNIRPSGFLAIFPFLTSLLAVYQSYRAILSPKLTYIPSPEPVTKKVQVLRELQVQWKWTISEAKNGCSVFIDLRGFFRREILFICTEDGYYFNCMVRVNGTMGDGVSIFQTFKIAKRIKELSNPTAIHQTAA